MADVEGLGDEQDDGQDDEEEDVGHVAVLQTHLTEFISCRYTR